MNTLLLRTFHSLSKVLLLLCFCKGTAVGAKLRGQARIDSLQQALNKETIDTQRVKTLSQLSFSYSSVDPEKGVKFGNEAVALAQKLNWEKGLCDAYYYRGANFIYTSRLPQALDDYLNALPFYERRRT